MIETDAKRPPANRITPPATYTLPRDLLDWLTEESERVGKKKSQLVKEALILLRESTDDGDDTESQVA